MRQATINASKQAEARFSKRGGSNLDDPEQQK